MLPISPQHLLKKNVLIPGILAVVGTDSKSWPNKLEVLSEEQ